MVEGDDVCVVVVPKIFPVDAEQVFVAAKVDRKITGDLPASADLFLNKGAQPVALSERGGGYKVKFNHKNSDLNYEQPTSVIFAA